MKASTLWMPPQDLVAAAIHQMPRSSSGPSSARSITRWPRCEADGGAGSPQGTGLDVLSLVTWDQQIPHLLHDLSF
uniref:Uncharacterized protein n=1 Tax=Zea mays TaxID=4577 RepID=A0A804QFG8_MAIZE